MMNCYYKILGVSARASQEEIKRAFRMLALRWHPDRNPENPRAAELFREALEAYETLVDSCERGKYDRGRKPGRTKASVSRPSGRVRTNAGVSLDEILEGVFGVHLSCSRDRIRFDLRFDLQVPRSALMGGVTEEILFQRMVFCPECCAKRPALDGFSCMKCNGDGELEEICKVKVWVPPGSEHGTRLRISGVGDQLSHGSAPGDLVIFLHIVEGL